MSKIAVYLDEGELDLAKRLGSGSFLIGIRRALREMDRFRYVLRVSVGEVEEEHVFYNFADARECALVFLKEGRPVEISKTDGEYVRVMDAKYVYQLTGPKPDPMVPRCYRCGVVDVEYVDFANCTKCLGCGFHTPGKPKKRAVIQRAKWSAPKKESTDE